MGFLVVFFQSFSMIANHYDDGIAIPSAQLQEFHELSQR